MKTEEGMAKRLANLRPHKWVKGQSGNPGGRPKSRVEEHLVKILTKGRLKKRYNMSTMEIDDWEKKLLVLTSAELKAIATADATPAYAKGLAVAILSDMKNGRSNTVATLRERQYGAITQSVEITGANGEPLIQKELSPKEAKALLLQLDMTC